METRVRYVVTGLFALVALLAGVLFLLWLQNTGSFRSRHDLVIRFDGPAAGLRVGAPVTFNGIRIGEVTKLAFDPGDPSVVLARLTVQDGAPISRDTLADVDTQGIVGNVQVALSGGTPEQRLQWRGSQPPVIDAHPSPSLTQSARDALGELRGVVAKNAEPLGKIIANVDTFAGALARNSDRVDTILAGLEKMTGGKQATPRLFDLAAPAIPALPEADPRQVSIADPSGLVMFDTQKLLSRDKNGEVTPGDLQWSDTVPKLVQRKLAQTLDQAGFRYASAGQDGGTAGATVQTEIRAFQIDRDPDLHADIALALRVVGRDGKVADARVFTASAPAESADGPQAAEAMNVAFGHILGEIAPWVADAVAKLPAAPAGDDNEPAPPPPPVPAPDGP